MSPDALDLLHELDPARSLPVLDEISRRAHAEAIRSRHNQLRAPAAPHRPLVRATALVAAAVMLGVGAAWAAGALSPTSVFELNAQGVDASPGSLWDQSVIPGTVRRISSVAIPQVGNVSFWHAVTEEGGWCGALQLPDGEWIGTFANSVDDGGTEPGCFPTRTALNSAAKTPILVIDGFDYQEGLVDARGLGGAFWRIRFGVMDTPSAVEVVDRDSGAKARVRDGLFELAINDPNPAGRTPIHLVALDASGAVVADDCPNCNP